MKQAFISVFLTALLFSLPSLAGSGHGHDHGEAHDHSSAPITSAKATDKVKELIARLVNKGKLEKSWLAATAIKTDKKAFSKGPEWVVLYKNDQVADIKKQNLYVFYSLSGQYIAANHSGI
ncbi:MAG: DUF6488 family protein [Bermanella sp.]